MKMGREGLQSGQIEGVWVPDHRITKLPNDFWNCLCLVFFPREINIYVKTSLGRFAFTSSKAYLFCFQLTRRMFFEDSVLMHRASLHAAH